MTTVNFEEVTCVVCGETARQAVVGSTSVFGSADLDTRPPEMERSTIKYWVHRCPSCGYCAANLSEGDPEIREFLQTPDYLAQLESPDLPELANMFICQSLIAERLGHLAEAAWNCVKAVWACDDAEYDAKARELRHKALLMIKRGVLAGDPVSDQPGASMAIAIDLARRAERFKQAEETIELNRASYGEGNILARIMDYQLELVRAKDSRRYTIDHALFSPRS